ncbi:hypothetical protein [Pseudodonghicola flavimaris]|uniref:Uncharacterized protein n=1 Tax=Pseudodonghicola flavimaris TaxID=3050036 RepID=A0ABT7F3G4_9RHOB|nr:hypothetical protein [Pseudodonghicola flavimaris]MDK3019162.1 hypothetical protein [Pseudodonghicola flavimaris]
MKTLLLSATLALGLLGLAPAGHAAGKLEVKIVTVMGRNWSVAPDPEKPGYWRAMRDWNNFDPFGSPARLRTVQAMAAFKAATGCTAIYSSMYQTIAGDVLTQLSCPAGD